MTYGLRRQVVSAAKIADRFAEALDLKRKDRIAKAQL